MRLIRFFKGHVLAWFICICLLIIQANLELSLPTYMSNIVDVGLQQSGIETPVPKIIRAQTLSDLELFMDQKDTGAVEAAYGEPDADGVRTLRADMYDTPSTDELASIMALPECAYMALEAGIMPGAGGDAAGQATGATAGADSGAATAAASAAGQSIDLETVRTLVAAGALSKDDLVAQANNIAKQLGSSSDTIIDQRAIQFVAEEYKALGVDMNQVRSDYLTHCALIMFALCAGTLATTILNGFVASRTAATIAKETRSALFTKVMQLSAAETAQFSEASLITRTTNDVQQIQMMSVMSMRMVMLAPIMGIVAFIQVTIANTGLEWIIGVAVLTISAVMGLLFGFTMPKFKKMQTLIDGVNRKAREMLDGLMPIRAFGRAAYEEARFAEANGELMQTQLFVNRAMSFAMPAIMLIMNLITVSIVWFGADRIESGSLQVGTMMAFISYTMQIVMAFMILAMVAIMLPRAAVAAERVSDVLDCTPSLTSPANPAAPEPNQKGTLVFDNVSFTYPDAHEPVIKNISFKTKPGSRTAIIGSTGSGKSTLVKLIPRLWDATAGSITLDGVAIQELALHDLRRRIGYVPQEGLLFKGTIAQNIQFAGDVSQEAMVKAATTAQAADFINAKEDGYQSAVSQKGANLSGGQRQRLCIARALAKDPEVLVFDDSFSALDFETDARLRRALKANYPECATVVVAQRVATITDADQILVLNDGQLVGKGTHQELLHSCPTYLEIASSQLSPVELGMTEAQIEAVLNPDAARLAASIDTPEELLKADEKNAELPEGGER